MTASNELNITSNGLQVFDPSTGSFTPVNLTAKGDLLVHNGSSYQVLTVGSNGQIFVADSAQSNGVKWAAAGSGTPEFISSQTASSSSSIEFTGFLDAAFESYFFIIKNVSQSFTNNSFNMQFSIDGGSSWITSNYSHVRHATRIAATEAVVNSTSDSKIQLKRWTGFGSSASNFVAGLIYFYPSLDPSGELRDGVSFETISLRDPSGTVSSTDSLGCGKNTTTSSVNGIRFLYDTGNITYGEFWLYGNLA